MSTNGQNGELNAVDTDSIRASPPPLDAWLPNATANRVRMRARRAAPRRPRRRRRNVDAKLRRPPLERVVHRVGDAPRRCDALLLIVERDEPEPLPQHVGVLVEDGLQVAVERMRDHIAPVAGGRLVGSAFGWARRRRSPVTSGPLKKLRKPAATQAARADHVLGANGRPVTLESARSAHCAGPPTASSARTRRGSRAGGRARWPVVEHRSRLVEMRQQARPRPRLLPVPDAVPGEQQLDRSRGGARRGTVEPPNTSADRPGHRQRRAVELGQRVGDVRLDSAASTSGWLVGGRRAGADRRARPASRLGQVSRNAVIAAARRRSWPHRRRSAPLRRRSGTCSRCPPRRSAV